MKKIIIVILTLVSLFCYSQVGIGTTNPHPSAILELNASNKALLLTRVALTGTNDVSTIPTPTAGMIVYNTADTFGPNAVRSNNLYRFNGTNWDFFVDNDLLAGTVVGFNTSTLGYFPVKASDRNTVAIAPNGANVTLLGCKTNPTNGHVYCAYQLSAGTNFYDTFRLAQQIGGYLVTMTSNEEREWVNTNILANGTGYNLQNSIWIGYNRVAYPGNLTRFVWITNENWKIDWSTNPSATPENWFLLGEPNNGSGIEGSCHIVPITIDPLRRWNDVEGSNIIPYGVVSDQVIVEFNE